MQKMTSKKGEIKEYEKEIPFHLPSVDDWEEIAKTLKLTRLSKAYLYEILQEINADVEMTNLGLRSRLTREQSLTKLDQIEKAAKKLRDLLIEYDRQLPDFVPHRALENIGLLFTHSAINAAAGQDIFTEKFLNEMRLSGANKNERFSLDELEQENNRIKSSAGLAYSDRLIVMLLNALIQPIEEWNAERVKASKGGRTKDKFRRDLVFILGYESQNILEEEPSSDATNRFSDLCELVFDICGVPTENLKNFILEAISELNPSTDPTAP
jgi:hypothetical protein